ncbi:hypothetical protein JYT84_00505, partial [bacterium AH-315-M10]|nr:hypothetical protein [bacterium AH-315-M10]
MRPTPVLYLVSVLILLSLVLWAFFPILGFDFLTPETWHGIQDLSGKHVLVVKSGQSSRLGKPLPLVTTYVSLLVDRTLWQENALGYHLTNLLLHLIAGLLVLMIVYELAGDWLIAVAAALLYSVHPLHLQVVAPVTARSDLVYVCLFLGAFSAYLKSRSTGSARWVVTAVVLYVLTLLEKPAAIGFGLLILVHDRIFLEAEQRAKRLPWLLMGLGALLLLAFHLSGRLQTPWALYK